MIITNESLLEIEEIVQEIYQLWTHNPGYILTESDLQCILFAKLSESQSFSGFHSMREGEMNGHRVHSEVSWYDNNRRLKYRTDITVLDTAKMSIHQGPEQDNFKLPSKGFYFDGQAIIFELKFNRNRGALSSKFQEELLKDKNNILNIIEKFAGHGVGQSVYAFHIFFDRYEEGNETQYDNIFNADFVNRTNVNCIYKKFSRVTPNTET